MIEKVSDFQDALLEPAFNWRFHTIKNVLSMKLFSNPALYILIRNYLDEQIKKRDEEIVGNCVSLLNNGNKLNLYPTIMPARMPSLSAKIARVQLKKIDVLNEKRMMNAIALTKLLLEVRERIQLPRMTCEGKNVFSRYPVKINRDFRDELMKKLLQLGIDTEKPYHYITILLNFYSKRRYVHTEELCNTLMTVPNHPCLSPQAVQKIGAAIIGALK
jgi:dTDP-4-amino-4,6-dideoxygalactose transaminase